MSGQLKLAWQFRPSSSWRGLNRSAFRLLFKEPAMDCVLFACKVTMHLRSKKRQENIDRGL